jgi:hypothetical protein
MVVAARVQQEACTLVLQGMALLRRTFGSITMGMMRRAVQIQLLLGSSWKRQVVSAVSAGCCRQQRSRSSSS